MFKSINCCQHRLSAIFLQLASCPDAPLSAPGRHFDLPGYENNLATASTSWPENRFKFHIHITETSSTHDKYKNSPFHIRAGSLNKASSDALILIDNT